MHKPALKYFFWPPPLSVDVYFLRVYADSAIRNFTRPTGKISTPRFPMKYGNYLDCYNYIPVPTGQRVIIMFLEFKTDSSDDYMTVRIKVL